MSETNRELFLKRYNELYLEYSSIDHTQTVTPEKRAFWIEGKPGVTKALFLAHGYMGSPSEMLHLAKPFIQQGWSIIGFLIPGHGSTSKVANAYSSERWQLEMAEQLKLISESFDEFHAAGFSTGGLLLHDFLRKNKAPENLKSVHLISPFFKQRLKLIFDRLIEKLLNNVSIDIVYFLTRFRDLKVMTINRQFYNQCIPVTTAREIKKLGDTIYKSAPPKKIDIPVQLFLTKGDWTVKQSATKKVIERDVASEEKLVQVWYNESDPHHLMSPAVSKVADDVQQKISSFVFGPN
jgi:esterase/lipase